MGNKPKNILIATNHLDSIGGTECYTYDLIKAISNFNGIELEYFTFKKGVMSNKINSELQIPYMSKKKYDLIIANHFSTVKALHSKGPIIQICHGLGPGLEDPCPLADYHVSISQEISERLDKLGFPNSVIINGVDIEKKTIINEPNEFLTSVLSLCQSEKANKTLKEVCEGMNVKFKAFNKHINPTIDVEKHINKVDMVVGIGRSIYDAMACGRPYLIYDNRGYNGNRADGYLRPINFWKYIRNNCSGRFLNRRYSEQDLIREFGKYNPNDGKALRKIAYENMNSNKMAVELLSMTKSLTLANRIKKIIRYKNHPKLLKHIYLYSPLYKLTGLEYFNKEDRILY